MKHRVVFWSACLLVLGCLVSPAAAQCMKWTLRTDVGGPGPQTRHCMTYNSDRQRVVLFTSDDDSDLWEYDGVQWLRVFVVGPRPSARLDSAIAYDRLRQELVLVGGFGRTENTQLADTWTCRFATDATGNVLGTWTRRADFPDFARPDPDAPELPNGESGARSEHSLVFDQTAGVVRLFGGKARITRGVRRQTPYNRENYSTGSGVWNGSAWVERKWSDRRTFTTPDPDEPPTPGEIRFRDELGRKLMAATFDAQRGRTVTYGGVRQIYQSRQKDSVIGNTVDEAYVEAMPHLQFFDGDEDFSRTSRQILWHTQGRCGQADRNRVFGAQLVHDTRRDRYVAFGGAFVTENSDAAVKCAPAYGVDTSTFVSQLLTDSNAFLEWDPQRPPPPDSHGNVRLPRFFAGAGNLPGAPASRIGHAMAYDEHRGVTVLYGGWDGTLVNLNGLARETWDYAPGELTFFEQPKALSELCLGDPLTLKVTPLSSGVPTFQWFHGTAAVTNATNNTLTIVNLTRAAAGLYTCELTDPCGNRAVSQAAVVKVGSPPVITGQPQTLRVCPGDLAEAQVFFTSDYLPSVQWYRVALDGGGAASLVSQIPVPGGDSNLLQFFSMKPADNGYYRARIANQCGAVWSDIIELTAGVWLKLEPLSGTNDVCTGKFLSVVAAGKGALRYQWRRNGERMTNSALVLGTDGALLTFPALRYFDDAAYDCLVSDTCNTVTTRVANLTVNPNPPFVLADTNGPAARYRHKLVYDSVRGVSVLFGGLGGGPTIAEAYRNDTWEYNGTNWTQRLPTKSPSGRLDFGMAFDRHRGRVVLFGGATNNSFSGGYHNGETWEYDGTNWTQRFPANSPAPRLNCTLFYDPVRRVTTLYGGDTTLVNPRAGDIWTWNGTNWTQKVVTGDRPLFGGVYGSPPRPQMVWDERRGYAVLPPTSLNQGGIFDRSTWLWNGTNWTGLPYAFTGFGSAPAQAGGGLGMVYDRFRGEVIYWGGDGNDQTYLWRWNGATWRRDDIAELVGFHLYSATAYDERRNSVVQFGGSYSGSDITAQGYSRRTFERVLADEPLLLRQPVVLNNPATNRLFVRIVAAGAPPLAYEWQRDGVKLTEGFPYGGTLTDTLAVDRALAADAGRYRCVVRGRCGEAVSFTTTLAGVIAPSTVVLTATSTPVAGQPGLTLTWSGTGVVLERAPAPSGPWTPVAGATSPYSPPLSGPSGFFRLRQP